MSEIQDNPYSAMLGVFRRDTDSRAVAAWRTGILRSLSPPSVEIGGQVVTAGVSINALLLGREGDAQFAGESGSITIGAAAAPGDRVLVLQSADGQEYAILCKVVI